MAEKITKEDLAAPEAQVPASPGGPAEVLRLTNMSGHSLLVDIVNPTTGEKDQVFVQHGGRPSLPPGFRLDPVFAARNQHVGSFRKTA